MVVWLNYGLNTYVSVLRLCRDKLRVGGGGGGVGSWCWYFWKNGQAFKGAVLSLVKQQENIVLHT